MPARPRPCSATPRHGKEKDPAVSLARAFPILDRGAATTGTHWQEMCSAVNEIDASALESLKAINVLEARRRHHSPLGGKGPVMDRLKRSHVLAGLSGEVFLSQHEAIAQFQARLEGEKPFDPKRMEPTYDLSSAL